jgi:hypothetical protein
MASPLRREIVSFPSFPTPNRARKAQGVFTMLKPETHSRNVKRFCKLAAQNLGYCQDGRKEEMHRLGKSILRQLAETMHLAKAEFDIRSNMGGIAVNGEITLHAPEFYLQLGGTFCTGKFMWRTCNGMRDYCGDFNRFAANEALAHLAPLANTIRFAIYAKREHAAV